MILSLSALSGLMWKTYMVGSIGLGGYQVAKHYYMGGSNHRALFEKVLHASGLKIELVKGKIETPKITSYKRVGDSTHRFILSLPAGLSIKDIQNKVDKFEEAFGAEVRVYKMMGDTTVDILTKQLAWPLALDTQKAFSYSNPDELSFYLGESREGGIRLDLATFPHLLVGGQTGGGKSVCLRLILTCLYLSHSPEDLRVHLVDMKGGVEFALFDNLPPTASFASDEDSTLALLDGLVTEYRSRMENFRQAGVTNITEYRALGNHLPYHVVVFDEFAELNPEEVPQKKSKHGETPTLYEVRTEIHSQVSRLLRLARAAGIHLIIATQRPDAKALPGQLKANIPVTIAFRCRNEVNSKILLDHDGACKLDTVAGRAILQIGNDDRQIQIMYLAPEMAKEVLGEMREISRMRQEETPAG